MYRKLKQNNKAKISMEITEFLKLIRTKQAPTPVYPLQEIGANLAQVHKGAASL